MSGADLEPALSSLAVSQSGPCLAFLFWGCPGQRFIWHLTTLLVRTGCRGQFSLCWFHSKSILVDPRVGHLPDLQLPLFLLKHVFGLAFAHVWVSRSCRNKLLQAQLKNTDIYFLTILEVRSLKSVITGLKSGCQQGHTPSGGPRRESAPRPLQLNLWPHKSKATLPPLLLDVSNLPLHFSYKDTCDFI